MICAHRDSPAVRKNGTVEFIPGPGAIGNASGAAALLEISKALRAGQEFKGAAVFLSVDGEEMGLTGSKEFVQNPPVDKVNLKYVIDLNCIGARGSSVIEIYATPRSTADSVRNYIVGALRKLGIEARVTNEKYPSDHKSFEEAGFPSMVLYSSEEPYRELLHSSGDTMDAVDPRALAAIVKAVVEAVIKGAEYWK